MTLKADVFIITDLMRQLTKAIAKAGIDISSGALGGEYGYGAYYQNEVFEMRPYFWDDCTCELQDDVDLHSDTCEYDLPNFKHYKTNFEVSWYKYIGRSMEYTPGTADAWSEVVAECIESIKTKGR